MYRKTNVRHSPTPAKQCSSKWEWFRFVLLAIIFLGSSVTARAPTSRKTANGEIAHFTCTLKYHLSSAEITWQKQGHNLRDGSSGVVIISWNNGTILESHLLVAVTDDDERRGTYTCVGTDEDGQSRRSFVIQGELSFKQYLIRDIFNWVSKIIHDFFCFALRRTITVQALQAVSNPHISRTFYIVLHW